MRLVLLVPIVATIGACDKSLGPVDGPMASATIYGRVTGPNGDGVPGVNVVVEAQAMSSCANALMDRDSVVTDGLGMYTATVLTWGEEATVCAKLRVLPQAGFAPDSVKRTPVRMHYLDPDSIQVDIVLRASA